MRFKIISILIVSFLFFSLMRNENADVVVEIIDGDTIILQNGEEVRLIGIDAPEKGERFYKKSKEKLESLVKGKKVVLEKDVEEVDMYGRLLRYVFVNNLFVNLEMIKSGYATSLIVYPNIKYKEEFIRAEKIAMKNKAGLWRYKLSSSVSRKFK